VRRTISIIDWHGFVLSRVCMRRLLTPSRVRVSVSSIPSRASRGVVVAAVELRGERIERIEGPLVVIERPGAAQSLLHRRPLALGR